VGRGRAIVFGEALIDVFPDGAVVAGAPLHVAVHLAASGWTVALATRVGDDVDGRRVLAVLERAGVETSLVQVDDRLPTGRVTVDLGAGAHRFTIHGPAAWDAIEAPTERLRCDVFVYGTLAARSPISRAALHALVEGTEADFRALDVNLRPPYVDTDALGAGLQAANLVKVNEDEFEEVAGLLGFEAEPSAYFGAAPRLAWLCVSRGERGAELFDRSGGRAVVGGADVEVVDTVGAGDAFTASLVDALVTGSSPEAALLAAQTRAGAVLARRGGLPAGVA
jgi:fructokinase